MLKRISFKFEVWLTKKIIAQDNGLFAYPVLVYLSFNQEHLYKKYLRTGKPVRILIADWLEIKHKALLRHIAREVSEVTMIRYHKLVAIRENKRLIKEYLKHSN